MKNALEPNLTRIYHNLVHSRVTSANSSLYNYPKTAKQRHFLALESFASIYSTCLTHTFSDFLLTARNP